MKKMLKPVLVLSLAFGIILAPNNTKEHPGVAQDPGGGGVGKSVLAQDPGGGGVGMPVKA